MRELTWEMLNLSWDDAGPDGARSSPQDVAKLIFSKNENDAYLAYFDVEETLKLDGLVYPSALPVVKTILAMLPGCGDAARLKCLELLASIGVSEPAPGTPDTVDACLCEMKKSIWYFIYGLQFLDIKYIDSFVDVLYCVGAKFSDFNSTAIQYLELSLTRNLRDIDNEMIRNTILDLRKKI